MKEEEEEEQLANSIAQSAADPDGGLPMRSKIVIERIILLKDHYEAPNWGRRSYVLVRWCGITRG